MTCPTSISLTFNPYDHHEVEFGNECLVVAKTMHNIMFETSRTIYISKRVSYETLYFALLLRQLTSDCKCFHFFSFVMIIRVQR